MTFVLSFWIVLHDFHIEFVNCILRLSFCVCRLYIMTFVLSLSSVEHDLRFFAATYLQNADQSSLTLRSYIRSQFDGTLIGTGKKVENNNIENYEAKH
jgi:hypothetical protein